MPLHRGKLQPPMMISHPIPLTRDDLELLKEPRGNQRPVERLRNSHHTMARFAAMGMKTKDIARRTGYAYNRVATLLNSPAMKELISSYRDQIDDQFLVDVSAFHEVAIENMVIAERMINDRLHEADENGELPKMRELLAISRDAADRFGFPKAAANLNSNVDYAAMLEKAIARSKTVENVSASGGSLVPRPSPGPASSPDRVPAPPPLRRRA